MGMIPQILAAYTGTQFMKDLRWLTVILISIACAFMTLYAVYIGYLFATANDAQKRKAAKDRLFKILGSIFIVVGLFLVLKVIDVSFNKVEGQMPGENNSNEWTTMDFEYTDMPTLSLTRGQKDSFKMNPNYLRVKDGTTLNNVTITNITIAITVVGNSDSGKQTFYINNIELEYTCPNTENDNYLTVNYLNYNGDSVVQATASFTYGEKNLMGSVNFWVKISFNDSKIIPSCIQDVSN